MDPLSVASGVAGLVTLADVVISRTYNTIIACKHASEDSRKLLREAQALLGIMQSLASLETKLGAAALTSQIPAAQVLACQQTLQNIRDKLEKSDPKEDGISAFQKAKRTLKWPLNSSETEKFLSEMERHKSTFDLALSADALNAILSSKCTGEQTDVKIDGIADSLNRLCKIESTKEDRRLLQLIGAGDADDMYRTNLKLHQHGTGLWFLEDGKSFSKWLATPHSKLWVYGIPGAGKTILSALAIDRAAQLASTTHGVIFYYCSHRVEESRHSTGIFKCLIGQLARQNKQCMNILERKLKLHEHASAQVWTRNDEELGTMLRKMIRRFNSVSIIIDGIDECHDPTAVTDTLASLVSKIPGVQMLILSRKEAVMEPFLKDFVQMSIAAENQDLRLYVPSEIEARTRLRKLRIKDHNVKDEIVETLVNGADGMFRWVVCQLDHLCDLTTDEERLAALKQLPRTLESTYDRILERVVNRGESICNLVKRSLTWIIRAELCMRELCEAVSIDRHTTSLDHRKMVDIEDILISCSSLVRVSADSQRLESAHFTVVEYLNRIDPISKPHLARFGRSFQSEEAYMAETCLTALLFDTITVDAVRDLASLVHHLCEFPFYWYAATTWKVHQSNCQLTESIATLTKNLFFTSWHYQVWVHVHLLYRCTYQQPGMDLSRYIVTKPGNSALSGRDQHADYVASLLSTSDWTRWISTPAMQDKLRLAAGLHQYHILKDLVYLSGGLNDTGSVGTPLHFAILGGGAFDVHWRTEDFCETDLTFWHTSAASLTVKTLIDLGADVNVNFPLSDGQEVTTALIACVTGHDKEAFAAGALLDEASADWLFEHGEIESLTYLCSIDINEVAERDRPAVIRLLRKLGQSSEVANTGLVLQPASFIDEQNQVLAEYEKMLDEACEHNDLVIVQWFFECSNLPFDQFLGGGTILHKACFWSSAPVVKYLISKGADINKAASNGDMPLACLLKRDGEPLYSTPGIMRSLLEAGATVYCIDEDNNSTLICWARKPYSNEWHQLLQNMLNIIVSFQLDLSRANDANETVWHALATSSDGHHLAGILDATSPQNDYRATFDMPNKSGWTPLHIATSSGHGDMMRLLISLGGSLTRRIPSGQNMLDLASAVLSQSHVPFHILLDTSWHTVEEVSHDSPSQDTIPDLIMDVVATGDLDRLKNFVAAGGNPALRCKSCNCTPLIVALIERQLPTTDYLLSQGVKSLTVFCRLHYPYGCSALGLLASDSLMLQSLQATLDFEGRFLVQDFEHMLHSAAANGNCEALEFMLDQQQGVPFVTLSQHMNVPVCLFHDNDISWMWTDGTALHTAVQSGQYDSIKVLLEHGFDPDDLNSNGRPCSHFAAERGHDGVLDLLLSYGGTVDARARDSITALELAVEGGHMSVVRLLVQWGADLSVRDNKGKSLFKIATASGSVAMFFALIDAGLEPTLDDILAWYNSGHKQIWTASEHLKQLALIPDFLICRAALPEVKAALNLVPAHYRRRNLLLRGAFAEVRITSLYREATAGFLGFVRILHDADAMLNLEGGIEGTPLMGACRNGRLDVVKYLVRNGAVLSYNKNGVQFNAFTKAASYPKIRRWFLVERFTEQRTIAAGNSDVEQEVDMEEEDTFTYTDDIADVTLDLVLEDEVEQYLESKNWFLPMRRFMDNGAGAFERVPIKPEDFARYRPLDLKILPSS